ncbi:unnamed protein product [Amoebophrya sp. A120]|nr:unnamed protein product [Amoebophrya sp. A120]|eukprot:GSA120T00010090001.1
MTDCIWVLPKFVMRHLKTEAPTDIDFVHHKFFDFVNFDSDAPIQIQKIEIVSGPPLLRLISPSAPQSFE